MQKRDAPPFILSLVISNMLLLVALIAVVLVAILFLFLENLSLIYSLSIVAIALSSAVILVAARRISSRISLFILFFFVFIQFFVSYNYILDAFAATTLPASIISTAGDIAQLILIYALSLLCVVLFFRNYVLFRDQGKQPDGLGFLTFLVTILGFIVPSFVAMSMVFDLSVTGLLATSGILTAIIGLALQQNISNIFSGIFLSIERPFIEGEWITVDGVTGRVAEMSWRTTRLRTFENQVVSVPNEKVAQSNVVNWDRPDPDVGEGYTIYQILHFHPRHDPAFIADLLYDVLQRTKPVDGRAELGTQWVRFVGVDQFGMKFSVAFDCTDRDLRNTQINKVMLMVHAVMANAGITLTAGQINNFMREDVGLTALANFSRDTADYQKGDYERVRSVSSNIYMESLKREVLLRRVRLFQALPDEDIEVLATSCTRRIFAAGEYVVKAGDAGDSLFVITEGVARVEVTLADSSLFEAAKLGSSDIFGEMSLLTGEKRTADIVATRPLVAFEISKDTLRPVLQNNPELYNSLSQVLAERKLDLTSIHAMSREQFAEVKDLAATLKSLIIRYFN